KSSVVECISVLISRLERGTPGCANGELGLAGDRTADGEVERVLIQVAISEGNLTTVAGYCRRIQLDLESGGSSRGQGQTSKARHYRETGWDRDGLGKCQVGSAVIRNRKGLGYHTA